MNVQHAHHVVAVYLIGTEAACCRHAILGVVPHFLDLTIGEDDVALKDVGNDKHQVTKVLSLGSLVVQPEGRDAKFLCNVVVFVGVGRGILACFHRESSCLRLATTDTAVLSSGSLGKEHDNDGGKDNGDRRCCCQNYKAS